jgi:HEAT repeat protein
MDLIIMIRRITVFDLRRMVLLAALLIRFTIAAEEPAPPEVHGPKIMGKTVEGWIAHLRKYENEDERKLAMMCLADFGAAAAPAVPDLVTLSKDELQPNTQRMAAEALGAIGPAAKPAIPDLLAIVNSPKKPASHRATACASIAQIDPEANAVRKAVMLSLRDGNGEVRSAAIEAAVTIAPFETTALPALARMVLTSQDAQEAATALRCIGEAGVDPLIKAVERGDGPSRKAAAEALAHMGKPAAAALPVISRVLKRERDPKLRGALALSLARLSPKDPEVLQVLVEQIEASEPGKATEISSASEAQLLLAAGNDAVPALRKGLRSHDAAVRKQMVAILAKLQQPSQDVIEELLARAQDKDGEVALAAIKALDNFGPAAAAAKESLLDLARHDKNLQHVAETAALNVSREAGKPRYRSALEARPDADVLAALKSPDAPTRQEAADALRSRSDDNGAIATALIETLNDSDEKVRFAAAKSLAHFGKYSRVAMATFIQWLEANNPAQQRAALTALAGMGPDAKPALPMVVKVATSESVDEDKDLVKVLSVVLRVIGPEASQPLLAELKNADPAVRARAARAVASMGVVGATAVPDLIEFSKSAVDSDAKAGFDALQSMGNAAYSMASPHLVNVLLGDLFADRRKWAALALGEIGLPKDANPKKVLDGLQAALLDPDESVCRAAHSALVKIGEPALPRLRELLKLDEGQASYWWAVRVMARMRADADLVVPKLIELTQPGVRGIKEGAFAERGTAAELLSEYAPEHVEAIPVLIKLLGDRDEIVAKAAQRTLVQFGSRARDPLQAVLRDRNPGLRRRAVEALESLRAKLEAAPEILKQ